MSVPTERAYVKSLSIEFHCKPPNFQCPILLCTYQAGYLTQGQPTNENVLFGLRSRDDEACQHRVFAKDAGKSEVKLDHKDVSGGGNNEETATIQTMQFT
uniref:Uncharacterized protein n=1 Tax=Timema poppense TaxID=170557 RepID=A0A7R9D521_TIMPO|nr:unnamed protein product [Timema poppensis]